MTHRIDELIQKIRELEEELEVEFKRKREEFEFIIEEKRVRFAEEVIRQHRRSRRVCTATSPGLTRSTS